jgi:predicted negative regulator of RcsB-dependent stress response
LQLEGEPSVDEINWNSELLQMAKDTKRPGTSGSKSNSNSGSNAGGSSGSKPASETELHKELEAIRERDFLQEAMLGFVEFLESNKALVAGVVVIALLSGVGVIGWDFFSERKEMSAQETFYAIEKTYSEKREKYDQAKFGTLTGAKVADMIKAGTAIQASGDLTKDYGTIIDDLETFAAKYKGTTAGVQAALLAAETRMQYKQADQAAASLQTSVSATKANSLIGGLARMAKGNAQAVGGHCDQALKTWEEVLGAKDIAFLHSEAALRAGLCLEQAGDKPKAIEMYRKAAGESEKSTSAQTAKTLLRALELGT